MKYRYCLAAIVLISFVICGCGGGGGGEDQTPETPSTPTLTAPAALRNITGPVTLTASPLNLSDIAYITPLGNTNPPGHTMPTSHMYFVYSNGDTLRNVYAPADGYIVKIRANTQLNASSPNDFTVYFAYSNTFFSYFGHVLELDQSVTNITGPFTQNGERSVEVPVRAGQVIGKSGQGGITMALDFGLINRDHTASLVNLNRYEPDTIHKDSCLKYYSDSLKTQLYGKVNSSIENKDGKFDYDIAGTLSGNWFGPGWTNGGDSASFANTLCFVASVYDQDYPLVTMGGDLGLTGAYSVDQSAPLFRNVTPQSGVISYKLYRLGTNPAQQVGLLLVQMLNNTQIKVQLFTGSVQSATFDSGAKTYSR